MLDHVAVGPLAENPARKDAAPFVVALVLHGQLDESPRFGRVFPRRGHLARAHPHDRAADAHRRAGLHLELADQPVALVEQADDGDRSEEHTSELQSLMRISYAVFCLKKNKPTTPTNRQRIKSKPL